MTIPRSILKSYKKVAQAKSEIPTLRLPPLPTPRDLIRLYKLKARRSLSQNFLLDGKLTDKIAKTAGSIQAGDVCEVGPGPGSITRAILRRNPGRLLVVEKDKRFLPFLEMLREASQNRLEVVLGDVLLLDMSKMFREDLRKNWEDRCPNIHLIGNLPFSVSSPLLIRWLRDISLRQNAWVYGRVRMTLTFQKEFAERMVAQPNDKQRCRLSVMCQNWCEVDHSFNIAGCAFIPPPDVDVGVVRLRPRVKPTIDEDFSLVERVVRQMFTFRQKKCIRCAETLFPPPLRDEMSVKFLDLAQVNPITKPCQLTMDEFHRLVLAFKHLICENPKIAKYKHGEINDKEFWQRAEDDLSPNEDLENESDEECDHHH